MHGQDRKSSYKVPPADRDASQHARRTKALDEQKRRRTQRVDSTRNLDSFAGLSLGLDDDLDEEPEVVHEGLAQFAPLLPPPSIAEISMESATTEKHKNRKPNTRYANKIMYAELLEMKDDPILHMNQNERGVESDGLPVDLDTNWVALAPVPRGKRCMAVANQAQGVPGTISNTSLKSRLNGRTILTFPSPLPPSTILDCILDDGWKKNGILHVLDIIRWKGQELGDCEANFRFWWRDTRLSEQVPLTPSSHLSPNSSSIEPLSQQLFSYPILFLPVPYHLDLSFPSLLSTIIPLSRSPRQLKIHLPHRPSLSSGGMEIDQSSTHAETATTDVLPDGLLLYVSQASYDPGISPLSSWVPITSYEKGSESPLDLFQRLVQRRVSSFLHAQNEATTTEAYMEQCR